MSLPTLNIGGRLLAGFGLLALLLAGSIVFTVMRVGAFGTITDEMADTRVPTVAATSDLVSQVYASTGALRGWMITGNPKFKTERAAVWNDIEARRNKLQELSTHWSTQENQDDWRQVAPVLDQFREAQDKVEAIAHTADEQPAGKLLATQAAPLASSILESVTSIIDEEGRIPSTDKRKQLLLDFANLRGSMAIGVASIRAYLLTGDAAFRDEFDKEWAKNQKAFDELQAHRSDMTASQAAAFDKLAEARQKFTPLPQQMFDIRASDRWNQAQWLLANEAVPRADRILDALDGKMSADGTRVGGINKRAVESLRADGRQIADGARGLDTLLWVILGAGLGAAGAVVFLTTRSIVPPIEDMTGAMSRLAEGDHSVEIPGIEKKDQIGLMAKAVLVFKEGMIRAKELAEKDAEAVQRRARRAKVLDELTGAFDADVSEVLKMVASAATELQATASQMTSTAEETGRQSTAVAAATEQASANVNTVAAATEELSTSVGEIGRQVSHSASMARKAAEEATRTNASVKGLAEAAQKIGEVINLIQSIASQTNLLALNATIEAARAGDAGKGFAVVASEVKALANQTARATEEIASQISAIQSATGEAVGAIGAINGTIADINEVASTIAAAVEEQGMATQDIARNVQQAAAGTDEVTRNISGVNQAANETGAAAHQVLTASDELANQAENLRRKVEAFLTGVKAA